MYNQISNNLNFRANLAVDFAVKDAAGLKKIQEKFAEATPKEPGTMYLSLFKSPEDKDVCMISHLSDIKSMSESKYENYYEGSNIIMDSFAKLKAVLSESEVVDFLVRRFRIMKLEDKYTEMKRSTECSIGELQGKYYGNLKKAMVLNKLGKTEHAKRYNVLANLNLKSIETLQGKIKNFDKIFNRDAKKIAGNDTELLEIISN